MICMMLFMDLRLLTHINSLKSKRYIHQVCMRLLSHNDILSQINLLPIKAIKRNIHGCKTKFT